MVGATQSGKHMEKFQKFSIDQYYTRESNVTQMDMAKIQALGIVCQI
jgi:hypothetical protein